MSMLRMLAEAWGERRVWPHREVVGPQVGGEGEPALHLGHPVGAPHIGAHPPGAGVDDGVGIGNGVGGALGHGVGCRRGSERVGGHGWLRLVAAAEWTAASMRP